MSMPNPFLDNHDLRTGRRELTAEERSAATRRLVAGVVLGILAVFTVIALIVAVA
jgi:hypothetical protein